MFSSLQNLNLKSSFKCFQPNCNVLAAPSNIINLIYKELSASSVDQTLERNERRILLEKNSTLNKSLRFENFLRSTIRFGSKNMVVPGNVWEVFEKYSHKSSDVVLNVMNGSVFVLSSFVFSISFRLSSRMKTFVIKNKPNIAYSLFNRECSREDYHNLRRASNFDSSELSKHQSHVNMSWCWNSCDKLVTCCDA